jgi:hypothetical protein
MPIYTGTGATLDIQDSILYESIQGIVNFGTATINDVSCLEIQNSCIVNEGAISVNGLTSNNSGQLLKHNNSGTFTDLVSNNTGVVLEISGGSTGTLDSINSLNSGLFLRAYGDQSGMSFSGLESNFTTQLFDFSDSISLTIDDIQGTFIESVLLANEVSLLEISNMEIIDSESIGLAMEISSSDSVKITDTTIDGYGQTFLFSGGGNFVLDDTIFSSNGKVGQLSSSTLSIDEGEWNGISHGLHAQHSSLIIENLNISIGENQGTALRILGGSLEITEEVN